MAKVALLIGVGTYRADSGLKALPAAPNDVGAIKQVLRHPDMGAFDDATVLLDPTRSEMEMQIETWCRNRQKDDLAVLFLSGHGVKDEQRDLYFAASDTRKDRQVLLRSTAVSARFVRDRIHHSKARRQVVILNCCFSGAFGNLLAMDDSAVDLEQQLGGEGRAILTSSSALEYSFVEPEADLSIYSRYLVEGIRTGAADANDDGIITVDELHEYARRKVQEISPAMTPQIIGKGRSLHIHLAKAPMGDPGLQYRKEVTALAEEDEGEFSVINRAYLDELQNQLGLPRTEAEIVETEVLAPFRQRKAKQVRYQQVFLQAIQAKYPLSAKDRNALKRLQQILSLREEDTAAIEQQVIAQHPPVETRRPSHSAIPPTATDANAQPTPEPAQSAETQTPPQPNKVGRKIPHKNRTQQGQPPSGEILAIHEFSPGITATPANNQAGWVSIGFTGRWMNATLDPIPAAVERAIANQEFAVAGKTARTVPAILGRVVPGQGEPDWSVIAIVTRCQDKKGRRLFAYRYFLCQANNGLEKIIAWIEEYKSNNKRLPIFDPFEIKRIGQPNLLQYPFSSSSESLSEPLVALIFELRRDGSWDKPKPIILKPQHRYGVRDINRLAREKAETGQSFAWAFNVDILEKPLRFHIIQAANKSAYQDLKAAIETSPPLPLSSIGLDEQALKNALKVLINTPNINPEAFAILSHALETRQIEPQYWQALFDSQGAKDVLSRKLCSFSLIRLITLRFMILPETFSEYLEWLNFKDFRKKNNRNQEFSLNFQTELLKNSFPKKHLIDYIHQCLLLQTQSSQTELTWFFTKWKVVWVSIYAKIIANISADLNDLGDAFSLGREPDLENSMSCPKETWEKLYNYLRTAIKPNQNRSSFIKSKYHVSPEISYKPLATIFYLAGEHQLSAYFFQVSLGKVPAKIFKLAFPVNSSKIQLLAGLYVIRETTWNEHIFKYIQKIFSNSSRTQSKNNNSTGKPVLNLQLIFFAITVVSTAWVIVLYQQENWKALQSTKKQFRGTSENLGNLTKKLESSKLSKDRIEQAVIEILCYPEPSRNTKCPLDYSSISEFEDLKERTEIEQWIEKIEAYQNHNDISASGLIDIETLQKLEKDVQQLLKEKDIPLSVILQCSSNYKIPSDIAGKGLEKFSRTRSVLVGIVNTTITNIKGEFSGVPLEKIEAAIVNEIKKKLGKAKGDLNYSAAMKNQSNLASTQVLNFRCQWIEAIYTYQKDSLGLRENFGYMAPGEITSAILEQGLETRAIEELLKIRGSQKTIPLKPDS